MALSDGVPYASNSHPLNQGRLAGQVVLVMQGGGAPGCYQAGAYQALHEAGIEPDWVIGTSIGELTSRIFEGSGAARGFAVIVQLGVNTLRPDQTLRRFS